MLFYTLFSIFPMIWYLLTYSFWNFILLPEIIVIANIFRNVYFFLLSCLDINFLIKTFWLMAPETEDIFGSSENSLDNPSWDFSCANCHPASIAHVWFLIYVGDSNLGGRQSPHIMRMDLETAKSEYHHAS